MRWLNSRQSSACGHVENQKTSLARHQKVSSKWMNVASFVSLVAVVIFRVENDKQKAGDFQSLVPPWLLSGSSTWLPDLLASI